MRLTLLRWLRRAELRLMRRHQAYGMVVYADPRLTSTEAPLANVVAAIALIRQVDQRRWNRLRADLDCIVLERLGRHRGEFDPKVYACVLDSEYAGLVEAARLARSIVHEGTHARFYRVGIGYAPEIRARIERRCLLEEVAFAAAAGAPLPDDFLKKLDSPWFSDEQLSRYGIQRLKANEAPEWAVRFVGWCLRRRQAARRRTEAV